MHTRLSRKLVRSASLAHFSLPFAVCLAFPVVLAAQVTAPPPSTPSPQDQTLKLEPFEVSSTAANSYSALNSNSLTGFNIALDRLPATADILDAAFMKDVGAQSIEAAISTYDAGAAFTSNGVTSGGQSQNQPGDHNSGAVSLWIRGFPINGMLTNGLQLNFGNAGQTSFDETSNYDIDRVEIIEGPQALLYTGGGPGGAVNIVTKQAYFGQPASGDLNYRVDQYGSKYGTFDFGMGTDRFAVRVALVDGTTLGRRVDIGDALSGAYVQLAAILGNTTFRVSLQQSLDSRVDNYNATLSSAGDPSFSQYNGDHLEYLLATNQAGGIMGGGLNWGNVQSLGGIWRTDYDMSESAIFEADSTWTKWFSTKLEIGGANFDDDEPTASPAFYSPQATANPIPGSWTMATTSAATALDDTWRPKLNKSINFNALLTNDLFRGKATSRTEFEADYSGNTNSNAYNYAWYQADSNWNPIVSSTGVRTPIGAQAWTVNTGPELYELFQPVTGVGNNDRITYHGVNYVRQLINPFNPNIAADNDGVSRKWNSGMSMLNDTTWLNGKLDTLIGVRYDHSKTQTADEDATEMRKPDFSGGVVYHLFSWLAPYLSVSDFWMPGGDKLLDGSIQPDNHTTSIEGGLKFNGEDGKVSGSLSAYHSVSSNFGMPAATLDTDVDPTGLNGSYPGSGNNISADVETNGITAVITANPVPNWRLRLSAAWTPGKFTSGAEVNQLYNDQFYEDKSGNVTYADGTVVYVPPAFNKSQPTVAQGTAGAVPLTVAMLSTPGSAYYANPTPITGAINATSNGGLVLLNGGSSTHGAILTGATGLPISAYQLNPTLSGVVPFGSVEAASPGDQTWGYPTIAFNFTTVYEFPSGWLKGFRIGGTESVSWRHLIMYYYPTLTGLAPGQEQKYFYPVSPETDLIAGYTHKFGRLTWDVQLNVYNMFNHYQVMLFPNPIGGYSQAVNISPNFTQEQPRYYALTTGIHF